MKILFISNSPINRQTSIGNTFLNLFDGFDAELYSVYSRTGYPDKKSKALFALPKLSLLKTYLTAKNRQKGRELRRNFVGGQECSKIRDLG